MNCGKYMVQAPDVSVEREFVSWRNESSGGMSGLWERA